MGPPRGKSDLGAPYAVTRCRLWLTTAALAVAGCAGPFPQSTLRPRSDYGRAIDHLFTDIFWWAVVVFVLDADRRRSIRRPPRDPRVDNRYDLGAEDLPDLKMLRGAGIGRIVKVSPRR